MHRVAMLAATLTFTVAPLTISLAQAPTPSKATTSASTIRAGTYDLEVESGGGVLEGTLVLTASGDSLTAKLHVGEHEPPVRTLTRKGSHLTLHAGGEGMEAIYQLDFDGDTLTGAYTFNGSPGSVRGKRRA